MAIVEIRMPQDESEGTEASLGKWLKSVGEAVGEHEPLVEISTDKVTVEIPAPAAGVLRAAEKAVGEDVRPGDLLGTIDTEAAVGAVSGGVAAAAVRIVAESAPVAARAEASAGAATYSPVVRRLLEELKLDPATVAKVGRGTRLTPEDIAAHLAGRTSATRAVEPQTFALHDATIAGRKVPHTPMRKSIAAHMARSVQAAPHVTSVFEADLSAVLADRRSRQEADPAAAAPSVTAYLMHAAIAAIRLYPEVNSRWHDAYLEVFDEVNFGVGTALESGGLVVPVLRDVGAMDVVTLAERLRSITAKARSGKLTRSEMEGGTFTLSNHGVSGSLLATPIILPHGQAAILGAGKLQKRPVVCETGGRELFRIRPMMYVTLTVDHRVLDGQQTNGFLTAFVAALEGQGK